MLHRAPVIYLKIAVPSAIWSQVLGEWSAQIVWIPREDPQVEHEACPITTNGLPRILIDRQSSNKEGFDEPQVGKVRAYAPGQLPEMRPIERPYQIIRKENVVISKRVRAAVKRGRRLEAVALLE